ncbi:MAG: type IV pilus assembly protein PilY1 [Flavobacteriales bacterium]|jgi:type IV pilus assembly protein PilY1
MNIFNVTLCALSFRCIRCSFFLVLLLVFSRGYVNALDNDDYSAVPPTVVASSAEPLIMLAMSNDNQLWHKAYTDYSDINGDLVLDTHYLDSFQYYGYYNSGYCYSYDVDNIFKPLVAVSDLLINADGGHKCDDSWSGNFMNWLTTTRIDVVRKVLYGGYRYVQDDDQTILQRALVPSDNHAFGKIIEDAKLDGSISDYTPITGVTELTVCNVTDYDVGTENLEDRISGKIDAATNPPKIKFAHGVQFAWSGNEVVQCQFANDDDDDDDEDGGHYSAVRPSGSNLINGIPGDSEMIVRVQACVEGLDALDTDSCRAYSDGSATYYRPYGILQEYGEGGGYKIGLITGSYEKNHSGGVLRKNVGLIGGSGVSEEDKEINEETGVFINHDVLNEEVSGVPGIIDSLNRLRIHGWNFDDNNYSDDCGSPGIPIDSFLGSGFCRDWGNPISELYLEALNYFAHGAATFDVDDSTVIKGLATDEWEHPFSSDAPCANCSIVLISTGLNNFDGDDLVQILDGAVVVDTVIDANGVSTDVLGDNSKITGLQKLSELNDSTDAVGSNEGFGTGTYIVGRGTGSVGNEDRCDAKSLANFSDAAGPCPEVPSLRGTYKVAGAAFHAHENDINALDGKQTVKTYTVSLAESLPSLAIPTSSGNSVTISPTCRANTNKWAGQDYTKTPWRECSLVDLVVRKQTENYGSFLISWEDSTWGNDYDMDGYAIIEYCTATGSDLTVADACDDEASSNSNVIDSQRYDSNGDGFIDGDDDNRDVNMVLERPSWAAAGSGEIQVRVANVGAGAGHAMMFGYIMSNSDKDGSYRNEIVRRGGWNFVDHAIFNTGVTNKTLWSGTVQKFTASNVQSTSQINNPLWYAAKYGNFEENENAASSDPDAPNGKPDLDSEWDTRLVNGEAGSDGIPDSYYPVSNPAHLVSALDRVFEDISNRVSAGSAAAVNAQTGSGEGAIYQAVYTPSLEGASSGRVTWIGELHGMFVDDAGRLREDGNEDGVLDDSDDVLVLTFDENEGETLVTKYDLSEVIATALEETPPMPDGESFPLTDDRFNPIWSATKELAEISGDLSVNRLYDASAGTGRYIFTSIDKDGDSLITMPTSGQNNLPADSSIEFKASNFAVTGDTSLNPRYLGFDVPATFVDAAAEAEYQEKVDNLVNFIRGVEGIEGMRSRTIDGEAILLGDLVHSTPEAVGQPNKAYDLTYADDTYAAFIERYKNRRNVVYIGANDGMLHAFNSGFFTASAGSGDSIAFEILPSGDPESTATAHPLGSELWAYIPGNLLPHLQWLGEENYKHVYYMDGPVQSFDVNIFPSTGSAGRYPHGWGTILVAGMRFGGADYAFDHDGDNSSMDAMSRSAFVVLDITDPEEPPRVLAEITDSRLGFTSSFPTIVKSRVKAPGSDSYASPDKNIWYLLYGSGPSWGSDAEMLEALDDGVSSGVGSVYTYNLANMIAGSAAKTRYSFEYHVSNPDFTDENGFIGGISTIDWNSDYTDDDVYFGSVFGSSEVLGGNLKQGDLYFDMTELFLNNYYLYRGGLSADDVAFSGVPLPYKDTNGQPWVFAGTGRFLTPDDNMSESQQSMYGFKIDIENDSEIQPGELVDTTAVNVFTDGRVFDEDGGTARLTVNGSTSPSDGEHDDAISNERDVATYIESGRGWRFDLESPNGNDLLVRQFTKAAMAGEIVVFTAYESTGDFCSAEGVGLLYAVDAKSGLPGSFAPLGVDEDTTISSVEDGGDDEELVLSVVDIGVGVPSNPVITRPTNPPGPPNPCDNYIAWVQSSTGQLGGQVINCEGEARSRTGWREIPVTWE